MDDRTKLYQLFVVVSMLVLLTGGILIGLVASREGNRTTESQNDRISEVSNSNVEISNTEIYEEDEELEQDVEIVYVDIYKDCNHASENRSNEYGVNIDKIKERELEKIEKEESHYKLVQDSDGVLMFEKEHECKCLNHYMLKFENDIVVIYRYSSEGEYLKYQETDIRKEGLRPDLAFRLEEGIEAETLEELYMFLEELES